MKGTKKMKRIIALTIALCMSAVPIVSQAEQEINIQATYYVSLNGNDANSGTKNSPFRSIERARDEVRKINQNMTGDIVVEIENGRYYIENTIELDERDSGTNGYDVIYRGAEEKTVLSGGKRITGFVEGENGIWQAKVNDIEYIRYLSINNRMAIQAQTEFKVIPLAEYDDPATKPNTDGLYIKKTDLGFFNNVTDMEMRGSYRWVDYRCKFLDIKQDPENEELVIATFDQPWYLFAQGNAWSWAGQEVPISIHNAKELLDRPNEFYFDRAEDILYYMPLEGEDLTTAIVEAGRTECIFNIQGLNTKSHVKNIVIENFHFVSTGDSRFDTVGFNNSQAHFGQTTYSLGYVPAAVEVEFADNIDVCDNVFTAMGGSAIDFKDGVNYSNIIGNAISDCGDTSINVGRHHNCYTEGFGITPRYPDGPQCVSQLKRRDSSAGPLGTAGTRGIVYSEWSVAPDPGGFMWESYTYQYPNDENPWLSIDLEKPYNIEFIEFIYGSANMKDEAGVRNFEVIVSNDKDFKNYVVLHTQGVKSPGPNLKVKGDGNKYRYVKIRKTVNEVLKLGYVDVFSYDEPADPMKEINLDVRVANNYITRVGMDSRMSTGAAIYYTKNLIFEHNYITEVPYSGLTIGWAWERMADSTAFENATFRYNDISRWNLECYDGGAFYSFGNLGNSKYYENYCHDGGMPYGAFYFDAGSNEAVTHDNVVENSFSMMNYPAQDVQPETGNKNGSNIHGYNNYATVTRYGDWAGDTTAAIQLWKNSYIDPPIYFVSGSRPPQAQKIVENAGLEPEYKHIENYIIKNNETNFGMGIDSMTGSIWSFYESQRDFANTKFVEEAQKASDNMAIGDFPGSYDAKIKLMLNEVVLEHSQWQTEDHLWECGVLYRKINNILKSIPEYKNRLDLPELIEYCDNLIAQASVGEVLGGYKKSAMTEFKKNYNTIKLSNTDDYTKVYRIENELIVLNKSKYNEDIGAIKFNGKWAKIDKENKIVSIPVKDMKEAKNVTVQAYIPSNVKCYPEITDEMDITSPKEFSLYNKDFNDPVIWTFKAEIAHEDEKWTNVDYVKPTVIEKDTYLNATYEPFMLADESKNNRTQFSFNVTPYTAQSGVRIIFGAKTPHIYRFGINKKHDHYELFLQNGKASIIKHKDGNNTVLASSPIHRPQETEKWNVEIIYENSLIKVNFNGKPLMSAVGDKIIGDSYSGIMAEKGVIHFEQ